MFSKVSKSLEKLLEDTLTLEVALERDTEPHILALLMPEYWAAFIREGSDFRRSTPRRFQRPVKRASASARAFG
jgi:hypothetical protein